MSKKPIEKTSPANDDELIVSNEEELIIKIKSQTTIQSPEEQSLVDTLGVVKTRH
jgi:hypothetical protein